MQQCEWRTITEAPHYEISSLGFVRRDGKILSPGIATGGYELVTLCDNKRRLSRLVHTLVARAFLGPRPAGQHIDHKDGDKLNNRATNLEYCAPEENTRRAASLGLMSAGVDNGNSKLTPDLVREIRARYATGKYNQRDLAAKYGIAQRTLAMAVRRITWRHVL